MDEIKKEISEKDHKKMQEHQRKKEIARKILSDFADQGYSYQEASSILIIAKEELWNKRSEEKINKALFEDKQCQEVIQGGSSQEIRHRIRHIVS